MYGGKNTRSINSGKREIICPGMGLSRDAASGMDRRDSLPTPHFADSLFFSEEAAYG